MSGGHFEYQQFYLQRIADNIEQAILEDERDTYDEKYSPETIEVMKGTISLLNMCYTLVQRIDWFLSGDDTEEGFHKRLKQQLMKETKEHFDENVG